MQIVGFFDIDKKAVESLLESCQDDKDVPNENVHGFTTADGLLNAFKEGEPRVLVFSLPHGGPVDAVVDDILQHLREGDIIVDCGNEWFENTVRRQKKVRLCAVVGPLLGTVADPLRRSFRPPPDRWPKRASRGSAAASAEATRPPAGARR